MVYVYSFILRYTYVDIIPKNASTKWRNGELTGGLFIVCIVIIVIISHLPFFFLLLFISYREVQLLKLNTQFAKKLLPASPVAAPRNAWLKREEEKLPQEEGAKSGTGTAGS